MTNHRTSGFVPKRVLIVLCYVVTFAAGAAMGLVAPRPQPPDRPHRGGFDEELNLTEAQRQQMREIWSSMGREKFREMEEQRRESTRLRNQAVVDLLTTEQKAEYDRIYAAHDQRMEQINQQRRQAFEQAQAKTREILTDEQRVRYDELIAQRKAMFEGGRGDRDRHRPRGEGDGPPPAPPQE